MGVFASGFCLARPRLFSNPSGFEYDAATGLLTAEIVEPDAAQFCVRTVYGYDGYGNKISATTSNCSGLK